MELWEKILTFIFVIASAFFEGRRAYFQNFKNSFKALPWLKIRLFLLIFAMILAALFFLDPFLAGSVHALAGAAPWIVSIGRNIGKNDYFWGVLMFLYATGWVLRNKNLRRISFGMLIASGVTAFIVTIIKFIILRARPTANVGHLSFFNLQGLTQDISDYQSFPSGDVSLVAGAGLYLSFQFKNALMRTLILCLPLMTAIARIDLNRHWPSDTAMSFLIAGLIGTLLRRHERLHLQKI